HGVPDDLGWEPIPGVAGASGCPHPNRLLTPICSRKRGKARQVDGAFGRYRRPVQLSGCFRSGFGTLPFAEGRRHRRESDVSFDDGSPSHLEAAEATSGPVASVRGEASGKLATLGSAEAKVDYEVEVSPASGLVLNVSSVPVTLAGGAEAHASGSLAFGFAAI